MRYLQSGRKARTDITWLNFHSWCKRVCNENGFSEEYDQLWIDSNPHEVLTNTLPQLVINILASFSLDDDALYDAVLVDEGQDFLPLWWSALRKICKPNGEMLLVADATQDIYDTAHSWTDEAMRGAGFRGDWSELKTSYRLPQAAMEKAVEFANNFLPQDLVNIPQNKQGSFEFETCNLRWVHLTDTPADQVCCNEILKIITIDTPQITAVAELTFLCTNRKFGLDVVKCLGKKGIRTVHTFHLDDKESRRQKMGFYMGDARVKATTLHSFKGWESRALVIYIDEKLDKKTLALIYTGLTRIKRHNGGSSLTIVSRSKELLDYGKSWPSFESM